jgi:hypothetical protein
MSEEIEHDNAADPVAVKKRGRKAKQREEQEADDLRAILGNAGGRRFLWAELSRRRVFQTAFHTDAMVFAHNEGRRSSGVELMTLIIETDPKAWMLMQQEAASTEL